MGRLFGGIEMGGTKFVCAIGDGRGSLKDFARFPTTTPPETLGRAVHFFQQHEPVEAIGIASFGPLDIDPHSPTYGSLTTTPKPGWARVNLLRVLGEYLPVPLALETDVNAAALGEALFGAGQDAASLLYVTVGTGVGGGFVMGQQCLHGLVHPEMGHVQVRRMEGDPFPGLCPFHGDCLEGLVSGPALAARTGMEPSQIPPDHPVWHAVAHYLGTALAQFVLVLSPERIVLGGGVMEQQHLFAPIRARMQQVLNGYPAHPALLAHVDQLIVPAALHTRPGVLGAMALARRTV